MAFGFSVSGSCDAPSSTASTRVAVDGSMRRFTSDVRGSGPRDSGPGTGEARAGLAELARAKNAIEQAAREDTNHRLRGLDWVMAGGVLQDLADCESLIRFETFACKHPGALGSILGHSGVVVPQTTEEDRVEEITV